MERRQSLIDVAIATGGSAEGVFAVAIANGVAITAEVPTGVVGVGEVVDSEVVELLRGEVPACGAPHAEQGGGIGTDIIGETKV